MQARSAILPILATCLFSTTAYAQQIPDRATLDALLEGNQILEDFESYVIAGGTAENLDVTSLDDTTVANGQGPGLVEDGATYVDPSGIQLQWNGDLYFQRTTRTLLANGSLGEIDVLFDPPVQAMGLDLTNFEGFGYSGTATILDTAGAVVDTVGFSLSGTAGERVFVGYQHDPGIGGVEIASPNYGWSPVIDDHGYGDVGGLGEKYCTATPNSTGSPASISASGSASIGANDLTLRAEPVPDQPYIFFHAANQSQVPFGNGFLCATGGIVRLNPPAIASGHVAERAVDVPAEVGAVGTRHFQCWFRDPAAGGAAFNTSNGLSITFVP